MLKKANISEEYPEPFRKAISYVREKKNYDFSVTELMRPLQAIYLDYFNDYEIEALKNTPALLGTAFHNFMENQELDNPDDFILEERYFKKIEDTIISGQADLYHKQTKVLWDYKTTGMYKVKKILGSSNIKEDAREWIIQANCYRYLSELSCEKIKILAIVKDFKYNNTYGLDKPAIVISLPLIKLETIEKWLRSRVRKINKMIETEKYPLCTDEEKWNGIRCRDWCDVNMLCEQYAKESGSN